MEFGFAVNICTKMLLIYILFAAFEIITRGQKQRGDPQEKRYINPDPERI